MPGTALRTGSGARSRAATTTSNGPPGHVRPVAAPGKRATCNTATQQLEQGTAAFAVPSEVRHSVFALASLVARCQLSGNLAAHCSENEGHAREGVGRTRRKAGQAGAPTAHTRAGNRGTARAEHNPRRKKKTGIAAPVAS